MSSIKRQISSFPHFSAVAWYLIQEKRQRSKILLSSLDEALFLKEQILALSPEAKVFVWAPLECDLSRHRGPSQFRRSHRIQFLNALHSASANESAEFFLIPADAMHQKFISPEILKLRSFTLSRGESLDRASLSETLSEMAYLPTELVEQVGQMALRGSIVDFFPPNLDKALRVELFGDEIQSLRSFHPESQRRDEEFQSISFPPVREFFFPRDSTELRTQLRIYLDDNNWDQEERMGLLDRIDQKSFFSCIDYWGPLIDPEAYSSAPLLQILEVDYVIDCPTILRKVQSRIRDDERELKTAFLEGEWVPNPNSFLFSRDIVEESVHKSVDNADWLSLKKDSSFVIPSERVSVVPGIQPNELLKEELQQIRLKQSSSALAPLEKLIAKNTKEGIRTVFSSSTPSQLERLQFLLRESGIRFQIDNEVDEALSRGANYSSFISDLSDGFLDSQHKVHFISDEEIFGKRHKQKSRLHKRFSEQKTVFSGDLALFDLKIGQLVVHSENGVGRYVGLRTMELNGFQTEFLEIEYRDKNKLFIPVNRLNTVQKFSSTDSKAPLDRMGGQSWEQKKSKAKKAIHDIAAELIHLYSKRTLAVGPKIRPNETCVEQFATSFPFDETPDQATAIDSVLNDLKGPTPMDRLVCGDVGYGKTEVAMRAAHAAVSAGFQVAILVPTTILASQHESNFRKRFASFGIEVQGLSRFKKAKESKEIIERLKTGDLPIVIGTHKLLSPRIVFNRLGLLVVDEEQRFGVSHKEKIKKLRNNVHVLTMTATPIPRTLNMAMSGLRELSIITTPPQDRLSVKTFIAQKKDTLIREAVRTEINRGGQVFYLHNRVQDIHLVEQELKTLLPEVKISCVHGQMDERLLEDRMLDFYNGKTQVLLTTTIIESGLDVPNANTLIVEKANKFGLSQLYQIRGRVGRSNNRAFAYFLLPKSGSITREAGERLEVLENYQDLGSGFHIASHDLDIRGAGDLLGSSQSGHMTSIGFDTYVQILQECIAEIKGEELETEIDPDISIPIESHIPDDYIPDISLRLGYYRKLAAAQNEHIVDEIEVEMQDRFGRPPQSLLNLLRSMRIKSSLRRLGISALNTGKSGFLLVFHPETPVDPQQLVDLIRRYPKHYQLHPDGRLIIKKDGIGDNPEEMLRGVEASLAQLEGFCR